MPRPLRTARGRRLAGVLAAIAVLVGGVALVGGFADVPRERLPVRGFGGTYDNGVYAVSVRSAAVVGTDPFTDAPLDAPQVVADVVLLYRGDEPTTGAPRWLRPLDAGVSEASVYRSTTVRSRRNGVPEPVQPGLPLRAVYRWTLPEGTPLRPGDDVRIGVYERYEVDAAVEGVTTGSALVAVFAADPS